MDDINYPKLRLPIRFYLAGSSQTGKSSLLRALIENQESIFERPFTRIIIARRAKDEIHEELARAFPDIVKLVFGIPKDFLENIAEELKPGDNVLLIFDDLITSVAECYDAENTFYVTSSKYGLSVILTSQNIFHPGKKLRSISLNCNLLGVTRNLRDPTQINRLARQLFPDNPSFLIEAYKKTMKLKPYNYLIINLHPKCDERLRVFTGILPGKDRIYWRPKQQH